MVLCCASSCTHCFLRTASSSSVLQLTALTGGLPRVMQRVDSLLETVRHGANAKARISAAHQLAAMLEEGEEAFKLAVGNAPARAAQRPHHPIGKLLAAVRRDEGEMLGTALQVGSTTAPLARLLPRAAAYGKHQVPSAAVFELQVLRHDRELLFRVLQHAGCFVPVQALVTPRPPGEGPEGDAALAGCVAGLRLLAAVANAGHEVISVPLRGINLEDAIKDWVLVDDHKPPAVQ